MRDAAFRLFDRLMGGQWGCPHGPLGWLAARLMERGNAAMNQLGLEALDVQPGESVLELGFGPGAALERIAAGDAFVAGIDPSEQMVRQAGRRLRAAVTSGRAEVKLGSTAAIPYEDARFDRVLTVNTIYFWTDPPADLREIRRVMKLGGRFVLVFRGDQADGALMVNGMPREAAVDDVIAWLRAAGFDDVSVRTREVPFGTMRVTGVALSARAA